MFFGWLFFFHQVSILSEVTINPIGSVVGFNLNGSPVAT